MSLIDNQVLPLELLDGPHRQSNTLKRRQANVELSRLKLILEDVFSLLFRCYQIEDATLGQPLFELELPVGNHGLRHDDQEIVIYFFEFAQKTQKGYCLNRFTQTLDKTHMSRNNQETYHLISQDSVDAALVKPYQPIDTRELIISQLAALETARLHFQSCHRQFVVLVF